MVEGKRHFAPRIDLGEDLPDGLLGRDVRVVRTTEDETYAFRHDEMRGYLAAQWAAVEDVSPVTFLEKTGKIWRLGKNDQFVVWEFFAEMIEAEMGKEMWLWAKSPERVLLQHALEKRGRCQVAE